MATRLEIHSGGRGAPSIAPLRDGSATNRILFVSGDAQLRALLSQLLAAHRYDVVTVSPAAAPFACRRAGGWDAAIIDAAAGHGASRWLRTLGGTARVPTIAIAAARSGATPEPLWSRVDAVLHEPFDARKLLLIIRGLFAGRRRAPASADQALTTGPITLQSQLNSATVAAREISLTDTETRILRELMLAAGTPVSRDRLTRCALRRGRSPEDRCLDTHVKRLRRKLGNDRHDRTPIRTVRGVGYLLLQEWEPAS
jgi:DNA-binding response OmpR family regulator